MNITATTSKVEQFPSSPRPQTSREVIQANVQLLIEQLEAGQSEALTDYLTAMGKFHNYSLGNILEIARQMPAPVNDLNRLRKSLPSGERGRPN